MGNVKDTGKSLIFASVASLGKKEYLNNKYFEKDYFDYIVIDVMGDIGVILSLVSGIILSLAITVACYLVDRMIFNKKFNIE